LTLKGRPVKPESKTIIKVGSDLYVQASSMIARRTTRSLVNGDSFAVFECGGDVLDTPHEPLGFFHRDTRHLSRFELKVAGETPYYLDSHITRENAQLHVNLSNPDLGIDGEDSSLPLNSLQIERNWVISGSELCHRVVVRNFARLAVEIPLDVLFDADFADLFEVRGVRRSRRGHFYQPEVARDRVRFKYQGLDGKKRFTSVVFDPEPAELQHGRASFRLTLQPDEQRARESQVTGGCEEAAAAAERPVKFARTLAKRRSEIASYHPGWSSITASSEPLNNLLSRSRADLTSIMQYTAEGTFVMAGIPWFATLFGRDSILTALSLLVFNPAVAVGTLKTLARWQGSQLDHARDEEPGKIVHEIRAGELAATGEVPFARYYGSTDSTPLFLCLLGAYVDVTGDLKLPAELWNHVERALAWIQRWGDRDGDGYVEYLRETPKGLANQGWKDSFDSISHADGTLARPPIALCEVQAYVYLAYRLTAAVARRLGRVELAADLIARAASLKERFARDFWLEDERTVALALDRDKQPCRVMASNAAHCLAAGLLSHEQADALASRLLGPEMFSGWGMRTLACNERRYNPMSYHNGSVWPHDNAIAAAGLRRISHHRGILRILEGLTQAAAHLKTGSLPELFCGFPRDQRSGPIPYPVACHPQAWSAASIFMTVQAMLGISVRGFDHRLVIDSPVMPEWLDWLKIENLRVGEGAVSLLLRRSAQAPKVEILETRGPVAVEIN
jgi:glycogen debranching enzyme